MDKNNFSLSYIEYNKTTLRINYISIQVQYVTMDMISEFIMIILSFQTLSKHHRAWEAPGVQFNSLIAQITH